MLGYVLGALIFLVFVPSVIWYLSLLDYPLFRIPIVPVDILNLIIAVPIFLGGVVFVVWSNVFLFFEGRGGPTDIGALSVSPRTQKLVTVGPYKYTRNPMVFGIHSLYLSTILYFNSLGSFIVWAVFFFVLVKYVLVEEEERLQRDFGDDYLRYKEITPRIIPLPIRKQSTG
jgi:protein-S-isoprenylcysteine O-methyltransferase Ste14